MPLNPSTRLGPYEIAAELGAGGMGEVYRATDTRLGREVAIKVLPDSFAADPERLARFEREATAPRAAPPSEHRLDLRLEEVRRRRTPSSWSWSKGRRSPSGSHRAAARSSEALAIAQQIAEALEDAHEKGIVHRDLKPQNVKAPVDGKVKVLDFGLAKALDPAATACGPAPQLAQSPTLTLGATQLGVILGTAAYMSPEQAKGRRSTSAPTSGRSASCSTRC